MDCHLTIDDHGREIAVFALEVEHPCNGWRLDRYLTFKFKRMSRTLVQRIIRSTLTLNEQAGPKSGARVHTGDRIVIRRPVLEEPDVPRTFRVLRKEPSFVAVDKPAGLPVHPTARFIKNTMTTRSTWFLALNFKWILFLTSRVPKIASAMVTTVSAASPIPLKRR